MVPAVPSVSSGFIHCARVPMPLGAHVLGRAFSDVAIRFLVLGRGSRSFAWILEMLIYFILWLCSWSERCWSFLLGGPGAHRFAWLVAFLCPLLELFVVHRTKLSRTSARKLDFLGCPGAGSYALRCRTQLSRFFLWIFGPKRLELLAAKFCC